MALGHIDLTIGATTTQVSSTRIPCMWVSILPPANDAYVGESAAVTSSLYGYKLAGAGTVPLIIGGNGPREIVSLHEIWINGTQNNVVHILYCTL